jgi:hypothetical protein
LGWHALASALGVDDPLVGLLGRGSVAGIARGVAQHGAHAERLEYLYIGLEQRPSWIEIHGLAHGTTAELRGGRRSFVRLGLQLAVTRGHCQWHEPHPQSKLRVPTRPEHLEFPFAT